ncbi:MAG: YhcH/YjgK/YiaL family protein [Candidatus Omnitrophota bacterium]
MIHDSLKNFNDYINVHPWFKQVSSYLEGGIADIAVGRYAVGDGVIALVSEYNSKDIGVGYIEGHRTYIDIQIMLNGTEKIGVCNIDDCKKEPYDLEKDLQKMTGAVDFFTLKPGYFAVFFPQDGHMPQIKAGQKSEHVKKMVIKVEITGKQDH